MADDLATHHALAHRLAERFSAFPNVIAVGLGGSLAAGLGTPGSDIDLYVYTTALIPLEERAALVADLGATRTDLNMQFWDLGDAWVDGETTISVDVMYWDTAWIAPFLDRVLVQHEASVGYTTCHWYTLRNTQVLYDREGWLAALKAHCDQPFPEELRQAIVAKNHPILRRVLFSYRDQIAKALKRRDLVSVNHRVAALLASYFDILFALNRELHPGEKRLLELAVQRCPKIPADMVARVEAVLQAAAAADDDLIFRIETLIDGLDHLLLAEGFDIS